MQTVCHLLNKTPPLRGKKFFTKFWLQPELAETNITRSRIMGFYGLINRQARIWISKDLIILFSLWFHAYGLLVSANNHKRKP
jgi:hypothetical protein